MTLVSGDAPDYPPELITRALESTADVVIGPSHDGGYCLLRTRMPAPELFTGISWSTRDVLDQTIAAARRLGRTLELLDAHPDVDTVADLRAVDLARAPATAACLQALEPAHELSAVPRVLGRTVDHESPWRRLVSDRLDTGETYSYLETPAAVWVVPVSADGHTVLVRQYRHPIGWSPLEVPAGSVEPGESAERAAGRELSEEAGRCRPRRAAADRRVLLVVGAPDAQRAGLPGDRRQLRGADRTQGGRASSWCGCRCATPWRWPEAATSARRRRRSRCATRPRPARTSSRCGTRGYDRHHGDMANIGRWAGSTALAAAVSMALLTAGSVGASADPAPQPSGSTRVGTWVDPDADGALQPGPGEPLRNRTELAPRSRPTRRIARRHRTVTWSMI